MKDCPIAHGDEGEGVILISWAFFHSFHGFGRSLAAREDPFGGGAERFIVVVVVSSFVVRCRSVWVRPLGSAVSFSKLVKI